MKIVKSDGTYKFYNKIEILERLELGNYLLKYDRFGMFLEETTNFTLPDKLYDFGKVFRDIVLKSHAATTKNTGVLLEGYKGQGKTVDSKLLCIEAKVPVIIIDSSIPLDYDFIGFLNQIEQEFVLFVDEFEKIFPMGVDENMYDDEGEFTGKGGNEKKGYHTQNAFLTIMDGALSNQYKKLFVFTTNEKVGDKFLNRPSRIKWHKIYQFMPKDMYNKIITDRLENKEYEEDLKMNLSISEATVDLLVTIIDQINTLDMPYSEFKGVFNHAERLVKYTLSVKFGTHDFLDLGQVELTAAPTRDSIYLAGIRVDRINAISDDEIIYTSSNITRQVMALEEFDKDALKKRENGELDFTYKLNKIESYSKKYLV